MPLIPCNVQEMHLFDEQNTVGDVIATERVDDAVDDLTDSDVVSGTTCSAAPDGADGNGVGGGADGDGTDGADASTEVDTVSTDAGAPHVPKPK